MSSSITHGKHSSGSVRYVLRSSLTLFTEFLFSFRFIYYETQINVRQLLAKASTPTIEARSRVNFTHSLLFPFPRELRKKRAESWTKNTYKKILAIDIAWKKNYELNNSASFKTKLTRRKFAAVKKLKSITTTHYL